MLVPRIITNWFPFSRKWKDIHLDHDSRHQQPCECGGGMFPPLAPLPTPDWGLIGSIDYGSGWIGELPVDVTLFQVGMCLPWSLLFWSLDVPCLVWESEARYLNWALYLSCGSFVCVNDSHFSAALVWTACYIRSESLLLSLFFRLVRFDPLGHYLLTAIVNPSNQQVTICFHSVLPFPYCSILRSLRVSWCRYLCA